jgi:hypothetical protein
MGRNDNFCDFGGNKAQKEKFWKTQIPNDFKFQMIHNSKANVKFAPI